MSETNKVVTKIDGLLDMCLDFRDLPDKYRGVPAKVTIVHRPHPGIAAAFPDGTWTFVAREHSVFSMWKGPVLGKYSMGIYTYMQVMLRLGKISKKEAGVFYEYLRAGERREQKACELDEAR